MCQRLFKNVKLFVVCSIFNDSMENPKTRGITIAPVINADDEKISKLSVVSRVRQKKSTGKLRISALFFHCERRITT